MKSHVNVVLGSVMVVGLSFGSVNADDLANWTFETSGAALTLSNSSVSPLAVAEGGVFAATSIASGFHASVNTDWSSPAGNGSPESFSANEWSAGDYWQFQTSTLGYQNIAFGWHQTRSSTGPNTFDLQYSLDGVNFFTVVDDYTVLENSAVNGGVWNSTTEVPNYIFAPFVGPSAWDNQASIWFRLTCQVSPALSGTNRVDNVLVIGTAIPAPGALALLGLAALTSNRRRRR
ncbi:MAG: PEP-CTERM sorting domain-containing protein [Phycisphaerales bacterium]|nr:PEP-CTERM sorting domain-containing protein [Phycisphaerales bacterium]MCI0676388.1 PEP-CTERM sorting domain-containing protein [Phycisphaerales bacterium]